MNELQEEVQILREEKIHSQEDKYHLEKTLDQRVTELHELGIDHDNLKLAHSKTSQQNETDKSRIDDLLVQVDSLQSQFLEKELSAVAL